MSVLALLGFASTAMAQYPARPIKMVVHVAPGGTPDIAARILGQKLTERFGQPVVVENRPGSNGNIAGDLVARSAPDGYTLLLGADSMFVINPHVYAKMGYDPIKDLVPVTGTVYNQLLVAVNPSVPVRNFREFVEFARAARPPLNYASGGNGSQHHLTMELIKQRTGIDLVHVPYKSGAPAVTAAISGEVPVVISGTSAVSQVKSGKLRAIAVTGHRRSAAIPDVPTVGEFYPGFEVPSWMGIWAPVGTPDAVLARLREETNRVLSLPEVKERWLSAIGSDPWISNAEEFAATIRRDYEKYGKVVKEIGVKID